MIVPIKVSLFKIKDEAHSVGVCIISNDGVKTHIVGDCIIYAALSGRDLFPRRCHWGHDILGFQPIVAVLAPKGQFMFCLRQRLGQGSIQIYPPCKGSLP